MFTHLELLLHNQKLLHQIILNGALDLTVEDCLVLKCLDYFLISFVEELKIVSSVAAGFELARTDLTAVDAD